MRDAVMMKLGAKEYPLRPAFSVVDAFESRYFGLFEHLERLMAGKATIHERAFLILQGAKAADPGLDWDLGAVQERLFEQGYWHESVVTKEAEFVESILYTPEQFTAKKQERAERAKKAIEEWESTFSAFSESPPSI